MLRLHFGLALTALGCSLGFVQTGLAQPGTTPDPVEIGLVKSLLADANPILANAMMKPFSVLMKNLTGLNGQASPSGDALEVGKKLEDKKLHLGVFQGFEYAWAKSKYPNLQPLMIAVYHHRHLKACLVVSRENDARHLPDLKGKDLAIPFGTKGHCKLFLDREVADCGRCAPLTFFSKLKNPDNIETALDDVCTGGTQAILVDNVSLECYQRLKPGCFKRLKVLKESATFPAAVIAYRDGVFAPATLKKFRDGMRDADKTPFGRQLMMFFHITAFENVPEDYDRTVANILRFYPFPEIAVTPVNPGRQ